MDIGCYIFIHLRMLLCYYYDCGYILTILVGMIFFRSSKLKGKYISKENIREGNDSCVLPSVLVSNYVHKQMKTPEILRQCKLLSIRSLQYGNFYTVFVVVIWTGMYSTLHHICLLLAAKLINSKLQLHVFLHYFWHFLFRRVHMSQAKQISLQKHIRVLENRLDQVSKY